MAQNTIKSILLVDDDADDISLFRDTLKEINHNTILIILNNGKQLVNFLVAVAELPDVVLLDLQMPLKDGYECLRELRSNNRFQTMPILVLSTSGFVKNVQRAYEHGADLYIQKPNTIQDLKKIIEFLDAVDWKDFKRPSLEHFLFPGLNN